MGDWRCFAARTVAYGVFWLWVGLLGWVCLGWCRWWRRFVLVVPAVFCLFVFSFGDMICGGRKMLNVLVVGSVLWVMSCEGEEVHVEGVT